MRFSLFFVLTVFLSSLGGEEKAQPKVEPVGDEQYRLGEIWFDAKTREVRLPVVVNMAEGGPIEYLLVHESGKIHEATFYTTVQPRSLATVLKLIRFPQVNFADSLATRQVSPEKQIAFEFVTTADSDRASVAGFFIDLMSQKPLKEMPFFFSGSFWEQGTFRAQSEGSFVAVRDDPSAMFHFLHTGAEEDERWVANPALSPPVGTRGTLIMRPIQVTPEEPSDRP